MMNKSSLIYIFPNLFTASSIFAGIVSIVKASKGEFEVAAWLILLALIFDGLDGRIARLTHTTSKFGAEFDSLADIISFGMAPAMLLYFFIGVQYGKFGILVSALFVIFGAIRLARFNVTSSTIDPSVFIGLPIPAAAVFITVLVLFLLEYAILSAGIVVLCLALITALLMVSNFRYPSFKKFDMQKPMFYKTLVLLTLAASLLYLFPVEGFVLILFIYVCFGPVRAIQSLKRAGRKEPKTQPPPIS
jgi:CDP-diacylglycerol--serine O-phosphatidyltransferase